jgi:hypothetical protein
MERRADASIDLRSNSSSRQLWQQHQRHLAMARGAASGSHLNSSSSMWYGMEGFQSTIKYVGGMYGHVLCGGNVTSIMWPWQD